MALSAIVRLKHLLSDISTNFTFSYTILFQPFKHQPHNMVKHTQTIRLQQPTNCLSVFGHFVRLALKGLTLRQAYPGPYSYLVNGP